MCGRFYIETDDPDMGEIIRQIAEEAKSQSESIIVKTHGEILPTDIVPVQTGVSLYRPMKWGFTGFKNKPVINARSETVMEKPMFRVSIMERRCLIPASGYYEWQKVGRQKIRYRFFLPNETIYFAGCYRLEKNSQMASFVILTRQATHDFEAIHDRMPTIIPKERLADWLNETPGTVANVLEDLQYEIY